jgi:ankyrin repeat protein
MTIAWSVSPMASDVEFGRLDDPHPLMDAVIRERSNLLSALINCGEPLDETNPFGWTALTAAAARNNPEYVRLLLDAGAQSDIKDQDGHDAFYYAADRSFEIVMDILDPGHTPGLVQELIEKTPGIEAPEPDDHDEDSINNLFDAIQAGNAASVSMMIAHGADVNETDDDGQTGLHIAVQNSDVETCAMLMAAKADASILDDEDFTALMRAVEIEDEDVVRTLLDGGANPDDLDEEGFCALMAACEIGSQEIASLLLNAGANVNLKKSTGHTALRAAVGNEYDSLGAFLIPKGADWKTKRNSDDFSIAELALMNGCDETINAAKNQGFDPDPFVATVIAKLAEKAQQGEKHLIMIELAGTGKLTLLRYLAEAGAELDVKTPAGWTPMLTAARYGHKEIVKILIRAGADINHVNDSGYGVLSISLFGDGAPDSDYLEFLLKNGASPKNESAHLLHELLNWGEEGDNDETEEDEDEDEDEGIVIANIPLFDSVTPDTENSETNQQNIELTNCAKLLIAAGANADEPDPFGDAVTTPITKAIRKQNAGLVRLLLEHGANPNVKISEDSDVTPIDVACESGNEEIVEILLKYSANLENSDGRIFPSIVIAAMRGHEKIVETLVLNGADINAVTMSDEENEEITNALSIAVGKELTATVELLLKHDAHITSEKITNEPPLVMAVKFVDEPTNILTPDEILGGIPILQHQLGRKNLKICQMLLDAGADANTEFDGHSVLELAALADNGDAITELLKHGANINGSTNQDETPLKMAIKENNIYATYALLDSRTGSQPQGAPNPSGFETKENCSNRSVNNLLQYYST